MSVEFRADSVAYWEFFSREAAELKAPLYSRLAEGVAGYAVRIAGAIKPGQPPANMRFGAVHFSSAARRAQRTNGDFPLTLTHYGDGAVTPRVLAIVGPQGSWLEWR